jgi:hypothetical protein
VPAGAGRTGEQNARLLAYLQAEQQMQQMQDFGNRLQSAAGWLQSIGPNAPLAPPAVNIPQRCTYSAWRNGVVQSQCMWPLPLTVRGNWPPFPGGLLFWLILLRAIRDVNKPHVDTFLLTESRIMRLAAA